MQAAIIKGNQPNKQPQNSVQKIRKIQPPKLLN